MKQQVTVKKEKMALQLEALLGLLHRVPFVEINLEHSGEQELFICEEQESVDGLINLNVAGRRWTLVVETKSEAQPRNVRMAVLQIQHYLRLRKLRTKTPCYGLLLASFISAESARILTEAGLGYVDQAGNARLCFGNIFIETHEAGNPLRAKRELKSLFGPQATRVLRVLLVSPQRPWKVVALAKSAGVSLGWVSAVRQKLLAQEWAEEQKDGLVISRPDLLMEEWAKADRWVDRTQVRQYVLPETDPLEIGVKVNALLDQQPHAFTSEFARWLKQPDVVPSVVTVYVREFPDDAEIAQKCEARRVNEGGQLWLVVPKDEGVFLASQQAGKLTLVSNAQIYLDLPRGGLSGAVGPRSPFQNYAGKGHPARDAHEPEHSV